MKEVSEQLIQNFLNNQCTDEEALQVEAYFVAFPDEIEKYISINGLLTDETHNVLDEPTTIKILSGIEKEIVKKDTKVSRLTWFKYAAAASIFGLTLFATLLYTNNNNTSKADNKIVQQQVQIGGVVNKLKTITNNTNKSILVALQDGSSVNLFPKSTLKYTQPFINNKRQLFLEGTGFFKVAKDKTRPFIVTAEGINTTALGTSFTIVAEQNSKDIIIKLFTGKVMISKVITDSNIFNPQYLLPGQQIQVNKASYAAELSTFKLKDSFKETKKQTLVVENYKLLNFDQTSLPEVFTCLEKKYKIDISYNTTELSKIKFTGKFTMNDEVNTILNNIAILNGLSVVKTNTGFEIKK